MCLMCVDSAVAVLTQQWLNSIFDLPAFDMGSGSGNGECKILYAADADFGAFATPFYQPFNDGAGFNTEHDQTWMG